MWSCHQYMAGHDRALEANPTLPFATAPELFPDPGRGTESGVRSYLGFKNKEKIETKGPVMVAYFSFTFCFTFFQTCPLLRSRS